MVRTHNIDIVGANTDELWITSWVTLCFPRMPVDVCFPVNFDVTREDSVKSARAQIRQLLGELSPSQPKVLFQGDEIEPFVSTRTR